MSFRHLGQIRNDPKRCDERTLGNRTSTQCLASLEAILRERLGEGILRANCDDFDKLRFYLRPLRNVSSSFLMSALGHKQTLEQLLATSLLTLARIANITGTWLTREKRV